MAPQFGGELIDLLPGIEKILQLTHIFDNGTVGAGSKRALFRLRSAC
jgi:hypothetical protein